MLYKIYNTNAVYEIADKGVGENFSPNSNQQLMRLFSQV